MNGWHRAVMTAYYAARDQWEATREAVTAGYAAEMAEYAEQHPRPLLRDFLRAARYV